MSILEQRQRCLGSICNVTLCGSLAIAHSKCRIEDHIVDLSDNFIKVLPDYAFDQFKQYLMDLDLRGNNLTELPGHIFTGIAYLNRLHLNYNSFKTVPVQAFLDLHALQSLHLDHNYLQFIPPASFLNMKQLRHLWLDGNQFKDIPTQALQHLSSLEALNLDNNEIKNITDQFVHLNNLIDLSLTSNHIAHIPREAFTHCKQLKQVFLAHNPLLSVQNQAFKGLPSLQRLHLSELRLQMDFLDLNGSTSLTRLSLDRGIIRVIPGNLCNLLPKLRVLNLGYNELASLDGQLFSGMGRLQDLTLSHNKLRIIADDAFTGLLNLKYLDLQDNRIMEIGDLVFEQLPRMMELNLGQNIFRTLPMRGLQNIRNLRVFGNPYLKDFPEPSEFHDIQILALSYAYHCCEFLPHEEKNDGLSDRLKEGVEFIEHNANTDMVHENMSQLWNYENDTLYHSMAEKVYQNFGNNYDYESDLPFNASTMYGDFGPRGDMLDLHVPPKPPVKCQPLPGPFMPCDDLMGWWSLRCGVWVVFLLAVLGNGIVLFISIVSHRRMDVPRFLICNLASADFLMGIYLGFLAVVDASTLGEFRKYAIKWQTSPGCQVAGFLGVLSSELSVFTLTVITMERFYAISHAVHMNKRLSLRNARYIVSAGWLMAIILAMLPLFGISDYRKFAICLPFETGDSVSLGYVCFIMLVNCIAFFIIVACYMKMYCSIRGSQAWHSNDTRIAKRMALLVFTDFACWAPITFFSLTAAFGKELISLNDAKVFTIFVLPLNSCANPFLYAIFTKQFKKDCGVLCKRIEESALNRSLSRLSQRNNNVFFSWGSRHPSQLGSCLNNPLDNKQNSMQQQQSQSAGSNMLAEAEALRVNQPNHVRGRRYSDGDFVVPCAHSVEQRECHSAEASAEHAPCPHCEIDAHYSQKINKVQNRTSSIFSLVQKLKKYQSRSSGGLEVNSVHQIPLDSGAVFLPEDQPKKTSRGFLPLLPASGNGGDDVPVIPRGSKLTPPHIGGLSKPHEHVCRAKHPLDNTECETDPLGAKECSQHRMNYLEPVRCPHSTPTKSPMHYSHPEVSDTLHDIKKHCDRRPNSNRFSVRGSKHIVGSSSSDLESSESSGVHDVVFPLDPNTVIMKCREPPLYASHLGQHTPVKTEAVSTNGHSNGVSNGHGDSPLKRKACSQDISHVQTTVI
ncbi:hypothetical protein CAPTEDRAFT_226336 [Capitella teleta]|uniref:G-protein coupled receptors family 1 profile domain-containing protein n=1 Tax=Capitella teleta TaxID=283909 RepID=R7TJL0_CAPTE|nr:hypothetical protein CAPTEDRAFT_226336 [Capitella teleta]|eukprot:ELT93687.1 hypothetical protein CAPTEDRAFT_226336 [Capitella teleta]